MSLCLIGRFCSDVKGTDNEHGLLHLPIDFR